MDFWMNILVSDFHAMWPMFLKIEKYFKEPWMITGENHPTQNLRKRTIFML